MSLTDAPIELLQGIVTLLMGNEHSKPRCKRIGYLDHADHGYSYK